MGEGVSNGGGNRKRLSSLKLVPTMHTHFNNLGACLWRGALSTLLVGGILIFLSRLFGDSPATPATARLLRGGNDSRAARATASGLLGAARATRALPARAICPALSRALATRAQAMQGQALARRALAAIAALPSAA